METPNDVRVNNWAELEAQLFHNFWQESIGRFRSPFAFRGGPDMAHDLTTTLIRLGGPYRKLEGVILRNFKKYAHRDASPGDSIWNWLAVAQHHGLPTRLLDWSYSPYVSLHFVTADVDLYDQDGVVWAVDMTESNKRLPKHLRKVLDDELATTFSVEMLDELVNSLGEFEALSREAFVIFFEPPSLDSRIVSQSALFSMMSSPDAVLNEWLEDKPELYRRIVIPAALKWEIRDRLDQINITERTLFPGLEGLTSYLKRYYSPRNKP
jgi:hypothetical protein